MTTVAPVRPKRSLRAPAPTSAPAPAAPPAPPVSRVPLTVSGVVGVALVAWTAAQHGAKPAALLLLGIGLGVALFHSRFGFTSAWRRLVAVGNGVGLRAHTVLLGATAVLFALIIGSGAGLFGSVPAPSAGTIGVGLLLGSFLFAIGMQVGGACASGTLFAVGSGQTSIVLTLGGFVVGSTLAAWQAPLWQDLPAFEPVLFADWFGGSGWAWAGSLAVTLALLTLVWIASRVVQARRTPPPEGAVPSARTPWARVVRGSWPLVVGALVLAVLGGLVMLVSGGAWGITSAFALWGSKLVGLLGGNPEAWAYFQPEPQATALAGPVLTDKTSLTDIGIIVGAALAASAAGVWKLHTRVPARLALGAVLGGIAMGIGARIAGGCNIGAYLAGIASGSAHGWIWGAVALLGTWVGLRLRPLFGLGVPAPRDSVC
ncbi:YeeE/YedE family protein [Isoptericola sp. F-RaC21]|uniref:YeeE/YedE family protein n=1 Tax=Isoptericola sp. F-RaC21 TaxID=3141452 RepID=UPI00315B8C3A